MISLIEVDVLCTVLQSVERVCGGPMLWCPPYENSLDTLGNKTSSVLGRAHKDGLVFSGSSLPHWGILRCKKINNSSATGVRPVNNLKGKLRLFSARRT